MEYDDLVQAGSMGLVKAADRFDEGRGLKFSTYAVPLILGEIKMLFREGGALKMSRSLKDLALKAMRVRAELANEKGCEPSIGELAERLGVSHEQVAEAIAAAAPPVSLTSEDEELDVPTGDFDGELIDLLALRELLQKLTQEDRELISLRYFKSKTQTEAAKVLGMSQVQVSRRERAILAELRQRLVS
jgi:RNA polymerase sporulation-specific sigma factor